MNKIYVSTFGEKIINLKNCIPIEVGAEKRTNFLYPYRDNIGDNISLENKYYGELTGLYWVWKNQNIDDDDMVGFCHFNKALDISETKAYKLLFGNNKYDFLVADHTYITPHRQKDELLAITTILSQDYPEYYQIWKNLYKDDGSGNECNAAQLFITKGKYFNEYCNFLFDVLKKMRKIIGDKDGTPYDTRYCAFMGERLLSVFIRTNRLQYKECHIRYAKKIVNIGRKVSRTLHISKKSKIKKSKIYRVLQEKFGAKSSYKKQ